VEARLYQFSWPQVIAVCVRVSSYSCCKSTYEEYLGASADCMMKLVPACLAVGQLLFVRPHGQTNTVAGGKCCSSCTCTWKLLMTGTVIFLKVWWQQRKNIYKERIPPCSNHGDS